MATFYSEYSSMIDLVPFWNLSLRLCLVIIHLKTVKSCLMKTSSKEIGTKRQRTIRTLIFWWNLLWMIPSLKIFKSCSRSKWKSSLGMPALSDLVTWWPPGSMNASWKKNLPHDEVVWWGRYRQVRHDHQKNWRHCWANKKWGCENNEFSNSLIGSKQPPPFEICSWFQHRKERFNEKQFYLFIDSLVEVYELVDNVIVMAVNSGLLERKVRLSLLIDLCGKSWSIMKWVYCKRKGRLFVA